MERIYEKQIENFQQLVVFCDGACTPKNPGGVATTGWAIYSGDRLLAEGYKTVFDGRNNNDPRATNNYAEYSALGCAIRFLADNNWSGGSVQVYSDSKLLVNQISKKWKCNKPHLQKLQNRIWQLLKQLKLKNFNMENLDTIDDKGVVVENPENGNFYIRWVRRDENEHADALSKEAYQEYIKEYKEEPKKTPPKRKVKFKEGMYLCNHCQNEGMLHELNIGDGNFCCPECKMSDLNF